MKIRNTRKFAKVFSIVMGIHVVLIAMTIMQSGCNSTGGSSATVSKASAVGADGHSGLWNIGKKEQKNARFANSDANSGAPTANNFSGSQENYSAPLPSSDLISIDEPGVQTASVYTQDLAHFEYQVEKGDSLWKISRKHNVSMRKIIEMNRISDSTPIHPGDTIMIPGKQNADAALASLEIPEVDETIVSNEPEIQESFEVAESAPEPVVEKQTEFAQIEMPKVAAPIMADVIDADEGIYEVEPGNSLYVIAMHHNTTVEEIKALNGLKKSVIRPGQKLKIPGKYKGTASTPVVAKATSFEVAFNDVPVTNGNKEYLQHEVQPGEYPGLIARKYNMELADLLHINNIRNPKMLRVGAKLKVINPNAMMDQTMLANNAGSSTDKAVASNDSNKVVTEIETASVGPVNKLDLSNMPITVVPTNG